MPIYEYGCPKCGLKFEKLRRMSEAEQPLPCPACGAEGSQRELSCFAAGGCGAPAGSGFR